MFTLGMFGCLIGEAPSPPIGYLNGFTQQQQIVIPTSTFPEGTTDFIALYAETDPDNRTIANGGFMDSSSAWDVRFELGGPNGNGEKLKHEIELYNPSTGLLVGWFRIPIIGQNENVTIYRYWGKELIESEEESEACWAGFSRVFHVPTLGDRTGSGATLVSVGTVNTDSSAMVGNSMSLAGTGLLRLDDVAFMDGSTSFTCIIRAKVG